MVLPCEINTHLSPRRTSSRISTQQPKRLQSSTKRRNKTIKKTVLPDITSLTRDFTFTGFDIDKDGKQKC